MSEWKRPDSIPFPNIWRRFERVINGETRYFLIQDATEDMYPFILDHMEFVFLKGEPICKYLDLGNSESSIKELRWLWRDVLRRRLSIVCFETDSKNGTEFLNFVGMNLLLVSRKEDEIPMPTDEKCTILWTFGKYCKTESEKIRSYEIYLDALGLCVHEKYRGLNIGVEILEARTPICQAINIPVTTTMFSNISAQKQALKAGFVEYFSVDYDELKKTNPKIYFKITCSKSAKIMYKRFSFSGSE